MINQIKKALEAILKEPGKYHDPNTKDGYFYFLDVEADSWDALEEIEKDLKDEMTLQDIPGTLIAFQDINTGEYNLAYAIEGKEFPINKKAKEDPVSKLQSLIDHLGSLLDDYLKYDRIWHDYVFSPIETDTNDGILGLAYFELILQGVFGDIILIIGYATGDYVDVSRIPAGWSIDLNSAPEWVLEELPDISDFKDTYFGGMGMPGNKAADEVIRLLEDYFYLGYEES